MVTRKKYPKEFKLDAISLVLDQGYTRREAARSLGINANMLGRWVKEQQADDGQARSQSFLVAGPESVPCSSSSFANRRWSASVYWRANPLPALERGRSLPCSSQALARRLT